MGRHTRRKHLGKTKKSKIRSVNTTTTPTPTPSGQMSFRNLVARQIALAKTKPSSSSSSSSSSSAAIIHKTPMGQEFEYVGRVHIPKPKGGATRRRSRS